MTSLINIPWDQVLSAVSKSWIESPTVGAQAWSLTVAPAPHNSSSTENKTPRQRPLPSTTQIIQRKEKSPPIFLGGWLDLLWAVWDLLSLRSGFSTACTCSESPQLALTSTVSGQLLVCNQIKLQSTNIFASGDNPFLFFSHITPGVPLWFGPPLLVGQCLFPAQTWEGKIQN